MSSQVDIYNQALSHVGHDALITSAIEHSKAAQICNLHYEAALRGLLEAYDWKFARKRQLLSQSAVAAPTEWGFRYAIPSDCVLPRGIEDGVRVRPFDEATKWAPEGTDILCDVENPILVYTAVQTVPPRFPQYFADALSWSLAARIVIPMTKNPKLADHARATAYRERLMAEAHDANLGQADPPPDGEFVRNMLT